MSSSSGYSLSTLTRKENSFEISVYRDGLTKKGIVEMSMKIQRAFPNLEPDFFNIFSDRIKANKFTDNRLKDAVEHVIDTCVYPTPTIAQFISFDKHVKLYTYEDVLEMNKLHGKVFGTYRPVKVGKAVKPMYAHINDIETYNLELWSNKND